AGAVLPGLVPDAATELLENQPDHEQAQAGAFRFELLYVFGPEELLEQTRTRRFGDPDSGVLDDAKRFGAVPDHPERDRAAVRGVLDGVRQQVVYDLPHHRRVDNHRNGVEPLDPERLAAARDVLFDLAGRLPAGRGQVVRSGGEADASPLQAGDVQQVVDQSDQPIRGLAAVLQVGAEILAQVRFVQRELQQPLDAGQRGPELVAREADEVRLDLEGAFHLARAGERLVPRPRELLGLPLEHDGLFVDLVAAPFQVGDVLGQIGFRLLAPRDVLDAHGDPVAERRGDDAEPSAAPVPYVALLEVGD